MRVRDILRTKPGAVVTVAPDSSVQYLLTVLAEHGIGAVVVSRTGTTVDGIVSERDVVRAIAASDAAVLAGPVAAIYTAEVFTAEPDTQLEDLMRIMHEHRVRHVPVVVDGSLCGIVSIGDVVRTRIEELEHEHAALTDYITGAR
jgi:CBS domain-containing protein